MSLVFHPSTQISFEDLSPERLNNYGITIVTGYEAAPVLYLCAAGTTVRVCPDNNGYCDFAVPENGAFPFSIFDALRHVYNCDLVRFVDDRGHVVTSLSKQEVIDVLGHDHQGPGDRIISCINGSVPDPDPGSVLNIKVTIGRELVSKNPHLLKDPATLLLLVGDIHEQRHPPFRVTLLTRNLEVACLYAEAMLAWAQGGKQHDFTNVLPRPNPIGRPLSSERENERLNSKREEGLTIDPETAEVTWVWGYTMDPYGIHPHLPAEMRQVQRNYFAKSPGSDTWVHFGDLPEQTREMLSSKPAKAKSLFS